METPPPIALYGEELQPGAWVDGYLVQEATWQGATCTLYRAQDERDGRAVALKVLHPALGRDAVALRRFSLEGEALLQLRHPHIVRGLGSGVLPDGRPYLVMEWLEGCDLARWVEREGALPADEALALVAQVVDALAAVHAAGMVHRDLKAQNVMVLGRREEGLQVRLVDFGVARWVEPAQRTGALTSTGHWVGTPIALAPEQIRGEPLGPATDVYAVGVLLYQLLTGRPPFRASTLLDLEQLHLSAPAPRVGGEAPVPPAVEALVARCLEKAPTARFASMAALAEALEGARRAGQAALAAAVALELELSAEAPDSLEEADALQLAARAGLEGLGLTLLVDEPSFLLAVGPLPPPAPQALAALLRGVRGVSEGPLPAWARWRVRLHTGRETGPGWGELAWPAHWEEGGEREGVGLTPAAARLLADTAPSPRGEGARGVRA